MIAGALDDTTNCCVCLELYEEKGELVPKLLPCTHTICVTCLRRIFKDDNSLDCPVCGNHHILEKGIDGINENRYILKNIRKPQPKCEKHDREFILFCDENGCKQVICSMCMREDHNNHSFKDLEDAASERRNVLVSSVEEAKKDVKARREMLLKIRREVDQNAANCVAKIKQNTDELFKELARRSEMLIEEVSGKKKDACSGIENAVGMISEKLFMLDGIKERAWKRSIFNEVTSEPRNIVNEVEKRTEHLKTHSLCQYSENVNAARDVSNILGKIAQTRRQSADIVKSYVSNNKEVPLVKEVSKDHVPLVKEVSKDHVSKKLDGAAATRTPDRYPLRARRSLDKLSNVPQKSTFSTGASVTPEISTVRTPTRVAPVRKQQDRNEASKATLKVAENQTKPATKKITASPVASRVPSGLVGSNKGDTSVAEGTRTRSASVPRIFPARFVGSKNADTSVAEGTPAQPSTPAWRRVEGAPPQPSTPKGKSALVGGKVDTSMAEGTLARPSAPAGRRVLVGRKVDTSVAEGTPVQPSTPTGRSVLVGRKVDTSMAEGTPAQPFTPTGRRVLVGRKVDTSVAEGTPVQPSTLTGRSVLVGRKLDTSMAEGTLARTSAPAGRRVLVGRKADTSTPVASVLPVGFVLRKRADPLLPKGAPTHSPGTTGQHVSLSITSPGDYLAVLMKQAPCSPIIKPSHLVYATTPDGRYLVERTPDGGFVPGAVGQIHGTISQDIRKTSLIKKRKDSPTKMTSSAPLALLGSTPDSIKNTPSGSASESAPSDSSVRKSPRSLAARKLSPAGKITESGSIVRKDPPSV